MQLTNTNIAYLYNVSMVLKYLRLQWFVTDVIRQDNKPKSVQIMHKISLNIQAEIV
jgi:hypothetical protein